MTDLAWYTPSILWVCLSIFIYIFFYFCYFLTIRDSEDSRYRDYLIIGITLDLTNVQICIMVFCFFFVCVMEERAR